MELIRLEDIHKTYHLGEVDVPVLRGVSLTIEQGEMVALMGASGSGKTTLMNILGCLDHPSAGKYWLDGVEMSRLTPNGRALVRMEKLGFVFQSFNLLPRTTAVQNVLMPLDYSPHRPSSHTARQMAESLLQRVGLAERIHHEPSQMSGGQQQRVAIARSLINRPSLILADEPTGNLDSRTSVEILRMFQQLNAEGITVILVTHDAGVADYASRVVHIRDGRIDGDTPTSLANGERSHEIHLDGNGDHHAGENRVPAPHSEGYRDEPSHQGNGNGNGHKVIAAPHLAAGGEKNIVRAGATIATAVSVAAMAKPHAATQPVESAATAFDELAFSRHRTASSLVPRTFVTAMRALKRNKMRSILSALGVIIAVSAVITIIAIGQGANTIMQKTISNMGANTLMVMSGASTSGGISSGAGTVVTLTPEDSEEIGRQCPAVTYVSPLVRARTQLVYRNRNWVPQFIYGVSPPYLKIQEWNSFDEGEMFTEADVRNSNQVCVIGTTIKRELFQSESPLGKEIRIRGVTFRIIGVLSKKGANMMGMDQDDVIMAPWTSIKYRVSGSALTNTNQSAATSTTTTTSTTSLYPGSASLYPEISASDSANNPQLIRFANVDQISVKAASTEQIPQAMEQITTLLRERHRLRADEPDDFSIRDMSEITKALSANTQTMGILLLAVALTSLIVGGVGIMNIMLVSVTERIREIGLRMAVGARSYHILRQFLVEAVVLCLSGGGIGILLGCGFAFLVRWVKNWPTEISVPAIIAAVVVSATVGIIFGFYPAWKASRLDPIEALRYE